jgi:hypothetical protein
MGYRLIELTQLARKDNPNITNQELWKRRLPEVPLITDPNYEKEKESFFDGFYPFTGHVNILPRHKVIKCGSTSGKSSSCKSVTPDMIFIDLKHQSV